MVVLSVVKFLTCSNIVKDVQVLLRMIMDAIQKSTPKTDCDE